MHPFLTYSFSLRLLKLMRRGSLRPGSERVPVHSFAVCVSAYNEEAVIEAKAENLLALRRATRLPVDLLIYVDAASDRTAELLRPYADRIRIVEGRERHGKSTGMNRLVEMTDADLVVFSDANVMLDPEALTRLEPHFFDPAVGCVCGHLRYTNGQDSATATIGSTYWRTEERIKQLESDTGGVIGADGSVFAIRRALHRPVPPDIIDDFYLSLSILCDGYRVIRADDVCATETATTESADEFRRKVRIACQAFNVHRLMRRRLTGLPWLLRYKYVSHKLLRWLALINAALGCFFAVAAVIAWQGWATGLAGVAAGLMLTGLVLTGLSASLSRVREVLLALVATTFGVIRSLKGDRFQTWLPPASRAVGAIE